MTITIEALKEKARRHEQDEEWRAALDLYLRAIRRLDEEDRPDIALHNRVGDLYARVGSSDAAVEHYETAVDLYEDSGLANNAIAVCKKIIRNVPERHRVYLRMGMIRARQGFFVDARHHFLTYAERMKRSGDFDEAMRALVEFAELAPGDAEIRLAIATQFEQHERPEEAADQLARAYQTLRAADDARADDVGEKLLSLRPDADLAALDTAGRPDAPLETTSFSADDLGDPVAPGAEIDDPHLGGFEIAVAGDDADGSEDAAGGADDHPDHRVRAVGTGAPAADVDDGAAFEAAKADGSFADELDDDFEVATPLPLMAFDDTDRPDEVGGDELAATEMEGLEPDRGIGRAAAAGYAAGDDDPDEEGEAEPLPFLEGTQVPPVEPGPTAPGLPDLDVADAWTDPGGAGEAGAGTRDDEPSEAFEAALEERRADAREDAAAETAAAGDEPEGSDLRPAAAAPVESVSAADEPAPADEVEASQRAVERAFRAGSEPQLVAAYLSLAEALERAGAGERARGVYQQILGIDPDHAAARGALGRVVGTPAPAPEVASSEDYVDLGALIFGDDGEKTTRFVVAYEEPSGDEDADFAKMLSQFKAKVAENVDSSDVKAHHDLGVAYREMGLLDEAIEQFQKALRASNDHLATYEALGQAFLDKGAYAPAVRVLTRALDAPWEVEDELLGIYYYLGRAYEAQGNTPQAVEFYDRVFSLDINFADVTERLRVLR